MLKLCFLRVDELNINELWFVDSGLNGLDKQVVADLIEIKIKTHNLQFKINSTANRKRVLLDAHFVYIHFQSANLPLEIQEQRFSLKNTLLNKQGHGVTNFTLPISVDLSQEIDLLCPDAWLLNLSKPMKQLTETLIKTLKDSQNLHLRFTYTYEDQCV